jgi:hypothetical protein
MIRKVWLKSVFAFAAVALLFVGPLVVSAWTSSLSTQLYPSSTVSQGTSVYDMDTVALTNDGPGSPPSVCSSDDFGCIISNVYSGTCSSYSGSSLQSSTIAVTSAAESKGGATYDTPSLSTSGLSAGSYVWISYYTGTPGGYPRAPSSGYDCESMTIKQSSGVPEFPFGALGMLALLGVSLPAMIVLRSRFYRRAVA